VRSRGGHSVMTVNSVLYFVASVSLEMGLGHSPSSKKNILCFSPASPPFPFCNVETPVY
jgi:hypothetical protein